MLKRGVVAILRNKAATEEFTKNQWAVVAGVDKRTVERWINELAWRIDIVEKQRIPHRPKKGAGRPERKYRFSKRFTNQLGKARIIIPTTASDAEVYNALQRILPAGAGPNRIIRGCYRRFKRMRGELANIKDELEREIKLYKEHDREMAKNIEQLLLKMQEQFSAIATAKMRGMVKRKKMALPRKQKAVEAASPASGWRGESHRLLQITTRAIRELDEAEL